VKARNAGRKCSSHRPHPRSSAPPMSITYTAMLPVRDETVLYLSGLLHAERLRRGTRRGRRALTCFRQSVLVLRWLLDGTLIETDRVSTPGPTPGVDLWWSKKHKNHGGNIHVLTAPDGWPLWTSPVRPGREHDTSCLRTIPACWPPSPRSARTCDPGRPRLRRRGRHHRRRVQNTQERPAHRPTADVQSCPQPAPCGR